MVKIYKTGRRAKEGYDPSLLRFEGRDAKLPLAPTNAAPGTPEKLLVFAARAEAKRLLFHPYDARWEGDELPWVFLRAVADGRLSELSPPEGDGTGGLPARIVFLEALGRVG